MTPVKVYPQSGHDPQDKSCWSGTSLSEKCEDGSVLEKTAGKPHDLSSVLPSLLLTFIHLFIVCMYGYVCAMTHVWSLEDDFQELVLSSNSVGSRDWPLVFRLGHRCFSLLSHLADPCFSSLYNDIWLVSLRKTEVHPHPNVIKIVAQVNMT